MEYLIIISILIAVLAVLAVIYDFNLKKLKEFAKNEENRLNHLTDKYPSNMEICKNILSKINNKCRRLRFNSKGVS